jgi:hypothetical protein
VTNATRPRYLDPECPLTLAEGLAEFAGANPGLIPADDPALRELVRAHDSCHVLFGLTTSIEDEALADTWTLLGSTVTIRQYSAYLKHEQFTKLFGEIGAWRLIRGVLRALPRIARALVRSRRMTAKWPFFEYAEFLDTPIAALRRRFNVVPV